MWEKIKKHENKIVTIINNCGYKLQNILCILTYIYLFSHLFSIKFNNIFIDFNIFIFIAIFNLFTNVFPNEFLLGWPRLK